MGDYLEISDALMKKIKEHYSRPEIIKAMLESSPGKEVVVSFGGTGYGKRPDVLEYENDVQILVKKGGTSFHISEENWRNPLELSPGLEKKKLDQMRDGWDLIIDIDCPHWGISKIITQNLINELKRNGVGNVSVKFSGNKGFHIGVPKESFPEEYQKDFPELPRKISAYLLDKIIEKSKNEAILLLKNEFGNNYLDFIEEVFKKPKERLLLNGEINPYEIIEVDTLLISARHLYRMVYSVNEKSGLVSIPINPDKVIMFEKDISKIENKVFSKFKFLDRSLSKSSETKRLCVEASDFNFDLGKIITEQYKESFEDKSDAKREYEEFKEKIPEKYFPESIKKMLEGGLSDGKKRALFVLKNFLNCVGWTYDEIEKRLKEWNKTHAEPIRDTIMKGQLVYLKNSMAKGEKTMPPNYGNLNYYSDIIGEMPEYKKAKNPVSLAQRLFNTKD